MWLSPFGNSVIGTSHERTGGKCEDHFAISRSRNGAWRVLVVCDGAGSAKFGGEGAKLVADAFSLRLAEIGDQLETRPPGAWINDKIIEKIVQIRGDLRKLAQKDDISEYHCTLVAALIGPGGGVSVHIGDGAIIGARFKETTIDSVAINDGFYISEPKNGEYANETFFITENDWIKNLRISPIPKLDWMILASDGGCSFCLDNDLKLSIPLITEIFNSIKKLGLDQGANFLEYLFSNEHYQNVTHDDKTIVFVTTDEFKTFDNKEFIIDEKLYKNKTLVEPAEIQVANNKPEKNTFVELKKNSTQIRSSKIIRIIAICSFFVILLSLTMVFGYFSLFVENAKKSEIPFGLSVSPNIAPLISDPPFPDHAYSPPKNSDVPYKSDGMGVSNVRDRPL